jgi:murein L,D-transpeptidase YcbB/YkuD
MRLPNSRILWAILLCLAAGAGVSVSSRFLTRDDAALRLVLNIPANRLDVFEGETLTRSYPVSVGRRGFETPPGRYRISRVVWNPWWHPPNSTWARDKKPTPPGPGNPMGRVKLQFADLLYIHGTTEERDLGAPASHGCVRMANRDLVELTRLVHSHATRDLAPELIDQLEQNPKQTRTFYLRQPVPLAVNYDVVEVRDGRVVIHPDVYRIKGKSIKQQLMAALQKEGVDPASLNEARVDAVSRTRNATRISIPIDTLLTSSGTLSR